MGAKRQAKQEIISDQGLLRHSGVLTSPCHGCG
jgi:hypothetical protein